MSGWGVRVFGLGGQQIVTEALIERVVLCPSTQGVGCGEEKNWAEV